MTTCQKTKKSNLRFASPSHSVPEIMAPSSLLCGLLLLLLCSPSLALDNGPRGQGQDQPLDNGPRGWRWDVGLVDFPTTTNSTQAQALFNRAVALLHNFWYEEALLHFREIRLSDPSHAVPILILSFPFESPTLFYPSLFSLLLLCFLFLDHPPL